LRNAENKPLATTEGNNLGLDGQQR